MAKSRAGKIVADPRTRRWLKAAGLALSGLLLVLGASFFFTRNFILNRILDTKVRSYLGAHAGAVVRIGSARFSGLAGIDMEDIQVRTAAGDLAAAFHRIHRAEFGYERPGETIEMVNLRVRALARVLRPALRPAGIRRRRARASGSRVSVLDGGRTRRVPICRREDLAPGSFFPGPALVTEYSATTWVAQGWHLERDGLGILRLRRMGRAAR